METELKFQVPAQRRQALRRAVATRTAQRTRLQAVYADTADDRLAAAGLALRLRKEGRQWVQTLKGRGDGLMQRLEHELPLPAQRGEPALDPARHAGSAVGQRLLRLLDSGAGGPAALQPLYRTDIQRLHRTLTQGGARIELALDEGFILAGGRRLAVFEIEFELKSGPPAALLALAQRWVQRFGLVWDVRTKSERGYRLARGLAQVPAVRAPGVVWPAEAPVPGKGRSRHKPPSSAAPGATPAQAWQALLQSALAQVLPNAAELADAPELPESPVSAMHRADHLHQLRVGLRRLRTVLAWCADWGPDSAAAQALQLALREPFMQLGAARDGDVLAGALWPELQAAGCPAWDAELAAARVDGTGPGAEPALVVRDPGFTTVLLRSLALALPPPAPSGQGVADGVGTAPAATPLPMAAAALLQARWRQARRPARRFLQLPLEEQHRTRRRLKRLRYLLEGLLEGRQDLGWPRARLKRWHRQLCRALDALGRYNDLCMAQEALRARAQPGTAAGADAPAAWFALGWLSVQRPQAMAEAALQLQALVALDTPWPRSG